MVFVLLCLFKSSFLLDAQGTPKMIILPQKATCDANTHPCGCLPTALALVAGSPMCHVHVVTWMRAGAKDGVMCGAPGGIRCREPKGEQSGGGRSRERHIGTWWAVGKLKADTRMSCWQLWPPLIATLSDSVGCAKRDVSVPGAGSEGLQLCASHMHNKKGTLSNTKELWEEGGLLARKCTGQCKVWRCCSMGVEVLFQGCLLQRCGKLPTALKESHSGDGWGGIFS